MKKLKKIFESMVMVFNDERVKALYITIFIIIFAISLLALILMFPFILGILFFLTIFVGVYIMVLDNLI